MIRCLLVKKFIVLVLIVPVHGGNGLSCWKKNRQAPKGFYYTTISNKQLAALKKIREDSNPPSPTYSIGFENPFYKDPIISDE